MADAAALPRVADNEYQDYINFIRNHAYNAGQINAFVEEIQKAKGFASITAFQAVNGCGNLDGDVIISVAALDGGNYTPNSANGQSGLWRRSGCRCRPRCHGWARHLSSRRAKT
jgi:hypothetical protein